MRKVYGWHLLAKEVADFTNCNFFEVMDKSASEVFGIAKLIEARNKINSK